MHLKVVFSPKSPYLYYSDRNHHLNLRHRSASLIVSSLNVELDGKTISTNISTTSSTSSSSISPFNSSSNAFSILTSKSRNYFLLVRVFAFSLSLCKELFCEVGECSTSFPRRNGSCTWCWRCLRVRCCLFFL